MTSNDLGATMRRMENDRWHEANRSRMTREQLDKWLKSIKWSRNYEIIGYRNLKGEWVEVLPGSEWAVRLGRLGKRGLSQALCTDLLSIRDVELLKRVERLLDADLAALTAAHAAAVNPEVETP